MIRKYLVNVLIGIDQLVNAILMGDPDETISSRMGKLIRANRARWYVRWLAWILDKIDPNHCIDAIEEDEGKDAIYDNEHF